MRTVLWAVLGVAALGAAAGGFVFRDTFSKIATERPSIQQVRKKDAPQDARPLARSEAAILARAMSSGLVEPLADDASPQDRSRNANITDQDRRIRIPSNSDEELTRLSKVLDLNGLERRRVKSLLESFAHGQRILERYPEPWRTEKRYELQRQFRLSMHSSLPKSKEDAADRYLEQSR